MKRKVFIHYNERRKLDNDIVCVTTYDAFNQEGHDNKCHRLIDTYSYDQFVPSFFGMFGPLMHPTTEVFTTWFHSEDDAMFSADARAKDSYLLSQAEQQLIA